jgi:hypothetical protein
MHVHKAAFGMDTLPFLKILVGKRVIVVKAHVVYELPGADDRFDVGASFWESERRVRPF